MQQHALRTALTLYRGGTLDLETAARQAGVTPTRLEHAIDRLGGRADAGGLLADPDRLPLRAD